jgi:16S rRNA (guanine(966)-N(2))-methyltransferase RsmD
MVREALFNILGHAVPDRAFFDIFAGSGVVGVEALSRGASAVVFLERDFRQAQEIERTVREFGFARQGRVLRVDAYRWAQAWKPPSEPVNVFLSPPFADLERRPEDMVALVAELQAKLPAGSVLVLQSEKHSPLESLTAFQDWERRRYGRNVLLIWEPPAAASERAHVAPLQETDLNS